VARVQGNTSSKVKIILVSKPHSCCFVAVISGTVISALNTGNNKLEFHSQGEVASGRPTAAGIVLVDIIRVKTALRTQRLRPRQ
jgi:hypothetical protein